MVTAHLYYPHGRGAWLETTRPISLREARERFAAGTDRDMYFDTPSQEKFHTTVSGDFSRAADVRCALRKGLAELELDDQYTMCNRTPPVMHSRVDGPRIPKWFKRHLVLAPNQELVWGQWRQKGAIYESEDGWGLRQAPDYFRTVLFLFSHFERRSFFGGRLERYSSHRAVMLRVAGHSARYVSPEMLG